jgi:hypothetical protein
MRSSAMESLAAQVAKGIGYDWTGLSYEERLSGSQGAMLYGISLTIVFLCLAALYESWSIPVAVMLVVPLGIIGTVLATLLRGLSNDVFFQVGLLTTAGLASKNAILIVEFAKENHDQRHGADRSHRDRGATAAAPDSDDIAGLHPGCDAAGDRQRRGRRRTHGDWHRSDRRHVDRHGAGGVPGAGILCSIRAGVQTRRAPEPSRVPGSAGMKSCRSPSGFAGAHPALCAVGLHDAASLCAPGRAGAGNVGWQARASVDSAAVADIGWRQFFPDPTLQRLIALALANNRDLRVAVLNVQAAQAQYRIQRADLFPTIAASGVEEVEKYPSRRDRQQLGGRIGGYCRCSSTPVPGGVDHPSLSRWGSALLPMSWICSARFAV